VIAATAAMAGCASGAGQGGASGQSGAAPVSVPSATANPVTSYVRYTCGTAGKANPALKPVTLGLVNMQGGPPAESFPQATAAARAAVKMINTELGGVHGHPVKLATCFVQSSESQGQTCGQQMANAGGVDAVVFGALSIGNSSFYDATGGKIPVIISVSESPVDDKARNVFELEGSSTSASDVFGRYARLAYPRAKTAAIAYINNTGTQAISDGLRGSFQKAGFTVKMVPYSETATDLIGPATEMEQADIAVPACGFTDCPLMAKAIGEIGGTKPAVSTPLWTYLPPQSYPGGDLPHWTVGEAGSNLAYPADPAVGAYLSKSAAYGLPKADALTVFAELTWSNALVADKMMNEIPAGRLTPAAVAAKLRQFRGTVPLGSPDTRCGGTAAPQAPAVCNVDSQFFRYEGHGKWAQAAGWLQPGK